MRKAKSVQSRWARRARAVVIASSIVGLVVGACTSSDERRRASKLAGGCTINSDCQEHLICAFERCHEPCKLDRDCERDLRCVKSEASGVFVCQLEDETLCEIDKDCPGEQGCGADGECRDQCKADEDCVGDQICATSGDCASTLVAKDLVDAEGNIIPTGAAGNGGAGGSEEPTGGLGGAPTSGEPVAGAAGSPDAETPGGMSAGGASSGGMSAGGAGGAEPMSEGGGPSYPPAEYEETPTTPEPVENDDDQHAVPITESANIYISGTDHDWLSYTAPDDGRGHIVTMHIDQEVNLSLALTVRAAADFTQIDAISLAQGTTRDVYLTLGSGATALFQFSRYPVHGSQGMAFITLTDTPEADDSEPNNVKSEAREIELEQTVAGQILNPWVADNIRPGEDWFAVDLGLGAASFNLETAPSEGRLWIGVVKPDGGSAPVNVATPVVGATNEYPLNVTEAGTHYFVIRPYTGVTGFSVNMKPTYLSEQYSFSVSQ